MLKFQYMVKDEVIVYPVNEGETCNIIFSLYKQDDREALLDELIKLVVDVEDQILLGDVRANGAVLEELAQLNGLSDVYFQVDNGKPIRIA